LCRLVLHVPISCFLIEVVWNWSNFVPQNSGLGSETPDANRTPQYINIIRVCGLFQLRPEVQPNKSQIQVTYRGPDSAVF